LLVVGSGVVVGKYSMRIDIDSYINYKKAYPVIFNQLPISNFHLLAESRKLQIASFGQKL